VYLCVFLRRAVSGPADGDAPGDVGGVSAGRLGAAIADEHTAAGELVVVGVHVEDLAVDSDDGRERQMHAVSEGDTLHGPGDLILEAAGLGRLHSRKVHLTADGHGALDLPDLFLGLDDALVDGGLDEGGRGLGPELADGDAEKLAQDELVVGPVGRQVVDAPPGG
jgi:hypothetical protein